MTKLKYHIAYYLIVLMLAATIAFIGVPTLHALRLDTAIPMPVFGIVTVGVSVIVARVFMHRLKSRMIRTSYEVSVALLHLRRRIFELFGSDHYSFLAQDGLDRALAAHLDFRDGFFIECGANNGLAISNTYWFERFRGWRGVLIEALPDLAEQCRRNRPSATVINAALVADGDLRTIHVASANLMTYVPRSFPTAEDEAVHRDNAIRVQFLAEIRDIEVPARTLASIFRQLQLGTVDLFSLDVEGYEVEVLRGMDVEKNQPRHILVETKRLDDVMAALGGKYHLVARLTHHDYLIALN